LIDYTLKRFADETASESPAPGGGSISAYVGALGAALGTMVANLSAHKRGWDYRWNEFSEWAEKGKLYHTQLLKCVDEDTVAFNQIMSAFDLPKTTEQEVVMRKKAIQEATKNAIEVPLNVMKLAAGSMEIIKAMAETGNPNSISDAGVGALCARTAVEGAFLNVKINATGLKDEKYVSQVLVEAQEILQQAKQTEAEILKTVYQKI
jgi:glutamate formiminotransferase/formiminotetrahydrofolate cyclodeaminase